MPVKKSIHANQPVRDRWLDVEEVRLVSDLRIMHSKVEELYQMVKNLKRRHSESDIHKYADQPVLSEDIAHVDEIYLWFVSLKEENGSKKAM
jgi:hypothetical protein